MDLRPRLNQNFVQFRWVNLESQYDDRRNLCAVVLSVEIRFEDDISFPTIIWKCRDNYWLRYRTYQYYDCYGTNKKKKKKHNDDQCVVVEFLSLQPRQVVNWNISSSNISFYYYYFYIIIIITTIIIIIERLVFGGSRRNGIRPKWHKVHAESHTHYYHRV